MQGDLQACLALGPRTPLLERTYLHHSLATRIPPSPPNLSTKAYEIDKERALPVCHVFQARQALPSPEIDTSSN